MKLRLQAALAAAAAATPLGLAMLGAWVADRPQPGGLAALGLALVGNVVVAALWWRDIGRMLAGRAPSVPAHTALAGSLSRREAEAAALRQLADRRAAASQVLFEALPAPLIALDEARGVVRANPAAEALFGAAGDLPALLRQPALIEALDQVAADDSHLREVELALAVPTDRILRARVVPVDLAFGSATVRRLVLLRDRTQDVRLERMRADFIANAGHELRTPLASLLGFIETLQGPAEGDPAARRRFLGIMHDQAARMGRLLDDLLSLSRIELDEHAPPGARVDPAGLLRQLADGFEPRLAARGQRLEMRLEAGLPMLAADADQISQLVANLLDNAVKYGREGGVIRLSARPLRSGIAVEVADDGAGIAPEHLPRLTERFYRVDAGRSRAMGGTGLGLAIVKHITNRHRGRLEISSTPGKGSVFRVWLPAAPGG